jgi:uncharacterized protein (DUF169 family)
VAGPDGARPVEEALAAALDDEGRLVPERLLPFLEVGISRSDRDRVATGPREEHGIAAARSREYAREGATRHREEMTMEWQGWSDRLRRELGLAGEPIAVTFSGSPPPDFSPPEGKVSVCQALRRASEGTGVCISSETCGCPGGLVSLGLGELPAAGRERLVGFLVDREKVYCSRVALHRGQQTVRVPTGMASHVHFFPLARAAVRPDLVAFLGNPASLQTLLGFANYWEGGSIRPELAGPACRTAIAFPVTTGEIGVSLLDFGARRLARFADDLMLVSVPWHRMIGILSALEHGVGRASEKSPEAVEKAIDELGPVERA